MTNERRLRLLLKLGLIAPEFNDLEVMVVDGAFETAMLRQIGFWNVEEGGMLSMVEKMTRAEQATLVASVRAACPEAYRPD